MPSVPLLRIVVPFVDLISPRKYASVPSVPFSTIVTSSSPDNTLPAKSPVVIPICAALILRLFAILTLSKYDVAVDTPALPTVP